MRSYPLDWVQIGEFWRSQGLYTSQGLLRSVRRTPGRFREEENHVLAVIREGEAFLILDMKIFLGRPPYYRPWVELFNIRTQIPQEIGNFHGSEIERAIIQFWGEVLPPGGRIFVEYHNDTTTDRALRRGVPPALTRLGILLVTHGFLWLKDWYFAEGLREGSLKLQGEKPLNPQDKIRKLRRLQDEIQTFLTSQEAEHLADEGVSLRARNLTRWIEEQCKGTSPEP